MDKRYDRKNYFKIDVFRDYNVGDYFVYAIKSWDTKETLYKVGLKVSPQYMIPTSECLTNNLQSAIEIAKKLNK